MVIARAGRSVARLAPMGERVSQQVLGTARGRVKIADGRNLLYLSAASGWEMAIKAGLGRFRVADGLERFVPEQMAPNGIEALPMALAHALRVQALPTHHSDPFDRLLLAQAHLEDLAIVTGDPQIAEYGVSTVW